MPTASSAPRTEALDVSPGFGVLAAAGLGLHVVDQQLEIGLDVRAGDARSVEQLQRVARGEEAQVVDVGAGAALLAPQPVEPGQLEQSVGQAIAKVEPRQLAAFALGYQLPDAARAGGVWVDQMERAAHRPRGVVEGEARRRDE